MSRRIPILIILFIILACIPLEKVSAQYYSDVYSNLYTVDLNAKTITNIPPGTSKASFLSTLTYSSGATGDSTNISDPVASGDTLVVTSQYGAPTETYTVTLLSQEFIVVQIKHARYPSTSPTDNWCLPGSVATTNQYDESTQMVITKPDDCLYTAYDYWPENMCNSCWENFPNYCLSEVGKTAYDIISTNSPTCSGGSISTDLLNLTAGSAYKVYLYVPSYCSGVVTDYGTCIEAGTGTCEDICNSYGGQTDLNGSGGCSVGLSATADQGKGICDAIAALSGSPCSDCESSGGTYDYQDPATQICYYNDGPIPCTTKPGDGMTNVCACYVTNDSVSSFVFPFTFTP